MLGLINVRGEIRPVLDVARLLELEHESTDMGYVLMIRTLETVVGFKVDQIEYIRDLHENEVAITRPGNAEMGARHLKGVTQDTLMIVDLGRIAQQLVHGKTSQDRSK